MKSNEEYVYILDYETTQCFEIIINRDTDNRTIEDILRDNWFKLSQITYMVTNERITEIKTID